MSPIDRILYWNDEEQRLWRAGVLASARSRLHGLREHHGPVLVLAAAGALALGMVVITL